MLDGNKTNLVGAAIALSPLLISALKALGLEITAETATQVLNCLLGLGLIFLRSGIKKVENAQQPPEAKS